MDRSMRAKIKGWEMKNWPNSPPPPPPPPAQGPRPRPEGQEYLDIFRAQMEGVMVRVLSVGGAVVPVRIKNCHSIASLLGMLYKEVSIRKI